MSERKLFEEQTTASPSAGTAQTREHGLISKDTSGARRGIRIWLVLLFGLVASMIAVGGLTRLTDSGLSITEWRPITGAVPPLNAEDWQSEFEKYRQIPEYQLQNKGMSLSEFKFIYWWEWGHRQLGRFVGLVWLVGFVWLWAKGALTGPWIKRGVILGALGGSQGAVGWWMVHSGLGGEMLDVASYRLATHLCLAFIILGVIAWYYFDAARAGHENLTARRARHDNMMRWSGIVAAVLFFQIFLGALVAGIDAGRNYTDWPLMAGAFLPPEPLWMEPVWRNFFENDGLVQFMHRMSGYFVAIVALIYVFKFRKISAFTARLNLFGLVLVAQIVLGIITVMNSSPMELALPHQLLAVFLWVSVLYSRYGAAYPPARSVRD